MTTQVEVVPAEALVVGPDEVLIIHFRDTEAFGSPEETDAALQSLNEFFVSSGLGDRVLVLMADAEFVKVAR